MDAQRFDRIVRQVVSGATRRGLLRLVAALPLTGALAGVLPEGGSEAKNKHKGKHHGKGKGKKKCQTAGSQPVKGQCCQGSVRVCTGGCGFATVQKAINAASPGATITICPGTHREDLNLFQDVRLVGAGDGEGADDTILQGTGQTSVVSIFGRATLENLRITGGEADYGGGVQNSGDAEFIGCTVIGNKADFGGGGILNSFNTEYSDGGKLRLTDCVVSENTAGSISSSGGGGGIANGGTLRLVNSVVRGNTTVRQGDGSEASGTRRRTARDVTIEFPSDGGGITNNPGSTLILMNSEISGNTADLGGGINNFSSGNDRGAVTLDAASRVTENTANEDGGGIFTFGGTVTLDSEANVTANTPNNCATANGGPPVPMCSG